MNVPSSPKACPYNVQAQIHALAQAIVEDETGQKISDRKLVELQRHIQTCECSQCRQNFADRMEELSYPLE